MENQVAMDSVKWPLPVTILREGAFLSLAGAGVSVIIAVKTQAAWAREMIAYLICPMLVFGLLFVEYKIVESVIKRQLNLRLGYVQALGCVAIALYGLIIVLFSPTDMPLPPGLSERVLLWLCLFGEGVFVANLIRTYQDGKILESPIVSTRRTSGAPATVRLTLPIDNGTPALSRLSDWPNSPAGIFGVAAVFFAGMGIVLSQVGFPGSQAWIAWNGNAFPVSATYLCSLTALPFAIFAVVYFIFERRGDWIATQSATRIHLLCTVLGVMEAIRVYISWMETWANTTGLRNPVTLGNFRGAFALGALSIACFLWNLRANRL